ncbi:arsenate reductase family protein [Litorimonas haliclonae]|uniref:arsenate reductase family protein n=1 Tax=Litorimonas haliclonae TaxID=2081977 RepID=UPI0039EF7BB7
MTLRVYHLKSCDTCRKAIKELKASHEELDLTDVRADGVAEETLHTWIKTIGYEKVLNTRSTTWRALDDSAKSEMDDDKALALLSKHPTLIKRPVITDGDTITVGWKDDAKETWLN